MELMRDAGVGFFLGLVTEGVDDDNDDDDVSGKSHSGPSRCRRIPVSLKQSSLVDDAMNQEKEKKTVSSMNQSKTAPNL